MTLKPREDRKVAATSSFNIDKKCEDGVMNIVSLTFQWLADHLTSVSVVTSPPCYQHQVMHLARNRCATWK